MVVRNPIIRILKKLTDGAINAVLFMAKMKGTGNVHDITAKNKDCHFVKSDSYDF